MNRVALSLKSTEMRVSFICQNICIFFFCLCVLSHLGFLECFGSVKVSHDATLIVAGPEVSVHMNMLVAAHFVGLLCGKHKCFNDQDS